MGVYDTVQAGIGTDPVTRNGNCCVDHCDIPLVYHIEAICGTQKEGANVGTLSPL